MQNPDVPRTTQHHATTDQTPETAQHMPPGHPRRAGHHDHPTMITGERGARKPARPVREETDGKGPEPWAPHRRSITLTQIRG